MRDPSKEPALKHIKKRPGFSVNNALRFKPCFDQAISNMRDKNKPDKDVLVDYNSVPTLRPYTFHQRMAEALRWLIDYHDLLPAGMQAEVSANDYAMLRGLVKLRPTEEGILIEFPGSITASTIDLGFKDNTGATDLSRVGWKTKLQDFVDNGQPGKVFTLQGLILTDEDVIWIKEYLSGAFGEDNHKVDNNSIVVVK